MTDTINKLKNVLLENIDQIDDLMPYIMTFSNRLWYTKMIQQYEIWKLSSNVPGHVVELGVHFGESFFHWAKFVEIYNMGERETRVIGFDTFGELIDGWDSLPSIYHKLMTEFIFKSADKYSVKKCDAKSDLDELIWFHDNFSRRWFEKYLLVNGASKVMEKVMEDLVCFCNYLNLWCRSGGTGRRA